jgi:hypothetical protein
VQKLALAVLRQAFADADSGRSACAAEAREFLQTGAMLPFWMARAGVSARQVTRRLEQGRPPVIRRAAADDDDDDDDFPAGSDGHRPST